MAEEYLARAKDEIVIPSGAAAEYPLFVVFVNLFHFRHLVRGIQYLEHLIMQVLDIVLLRRVYTCLAAE